MSGSTLFGTTQAGGATNYGTVFAISLPAAPAPEPGTVTLLVVGTGLLYLRRRRAA